MSSGDILRRRNGKISRLKAQQHRRKNEIRIGDPLHESFYDADGTLKSTLEIRKQSIGDRSEGKSYKVQNNMTGGVRSR